MGDNDNQEMQAMAATAQAAIKAGAAISDPSGTSVFDFVKFFIKNWQSILAGIMLIGILIAILPMLLVVAVIDKITFGLFFSKDDGGKIPSQYQPDPRIDETTFQNVIGNSEIMAQNVQQCFKYKSNWYNVFIVANTRAKVLSETGIDFDAAGKAVENGSYEPYLIGEGDYYYTNEQWNKIAGIDLAKVLHDQGEGKYNEAITNSKALIMEEYKHAYDSYLSIIMPYVVGDESQEHYSIQGYFFIPANIGYYFADGTFLSDDKTNRQSINKTTKEKASMLDSAAKDSYIRIYAAEGTPVILPEKVTLVQIGWDNAGGGWTASFKSSDGKRLYKFAYLQGYSQAINVIIGSHDISNLVDVTNPSLGIEYTAQAGEVIGYVGKSGGKTVGGTRKEDPYLGVMLSINESTVSVIDQWSSGLDTYISVFMLEQNRLDLSPPQKDDTNQQSDTSDGSSTTPNDTSSSSSTVQTDSEQITPP